MDKKKKESFDINDIWKHRFWIACGLIAITAFVTWYMAKSSLDSEREKRLALIKGAQSSIQQVLSTTAIVPEGADVKVHPNTSTVAGMEAEIANGAEANLEAWRMRYEAQSQHLDWPEVISSLIRNKLSRIRQPEIISREYLTGEQRDTFREQIRQVMPELVKKIKANWNFADTPAEPVNERGDRSQGTPEVSKMEASGEPEVVRWESKNQQVWQAKLSEFQGKYGNDDPGNRPTTQQILALQQDLWILEAVFEVIAEVNGDASANDLAPVKKIDHVLVGRETGSWNSVGKVLGADEMAKAPKTSNVRERLRENLGEQGLSGVNRRGITPREEQGPVSSSSSSSAKSQSSFDPSESKSPFHGRYVDWNFERVNESRLLEALNAEQGLSADPYLHVARRLPVRIALIMDERKIEHFLAAAANSPFVFEIQRIRINKHLPNEGMEEVGTTRSRGDDDGGPAANQPSRLAGGGANATFGGDGRQGRGSDSGGDDLPESVEQRTNFDVKVEFFGVVKLYNPINEDVLYGRKKNRPDSETNDNNQQADNRRNSRVG